MQIEQFTDYILKNKIPYQVTLELTMACNLKCRHCYQHGIKTKQIGTDEYLSVIKNLKESGVMFLNLNGGEVTLSPSFWPVAETASNLGFFLTIYTNGTKIGELEVKRIAKLNVMEVRISLYGNKSFHDTFVRKIGAHDATVNALHLLAENNLRVVLCTCLMRSNVNELAYLRALASEMDMNLNIETQMFPVLGGRSDNSELRLNDIEIVKFLATVNEDSTWRHATPTLLDKLHERLEEKRGVCLAGNATCAIGPEGNVFPCSMIRVPAGNILNTSFSEIWLKSPLFNWFRNFDLKNTEQVKGCTGEYETCRMKAHIPYQ